jgi:signal transduction histidine kinase
MRAVRLSRADKADIALTLLLGVLSVVEAFRRTVDGSPHWQVAVVGLATVLPLAVRRRHPFGVTVVVLALIVAQTALLGSLQGVGGCFALLVAAFTAASYCALRGAVTALVATLLVLVLTHWLDPAGVLGDFDEVVVLALGGWAAGRAVWSRQELVEQLAQQALELDRRRTAEARIAAVEGDRRTARELHEVIAHGVSAVAEEAEEGEAALPDVERSRQSLRAITSSAHDILSDLGHLVRVLDDVPEERAGRPAPQVRPPGLRDAPRLVSQLRAAGLDVHLRIDGASDGLPSDNDLTAYRVLQDALTDCLQHPDRRRVDACVSVGSGLVTVEVVDHRPHRRTEGGPVGSGRDGADAGQDRMRNRVVMHGGRLESGAHGDGHRVRADIPVRYLA